MPESRLADIAELSNAILTLSEHGIAVETAEGSGACTLQGTAMSDEEVILAARLVEREAFVVVQ